MTEDISKYQKKRGFMVFVGGKEGKYKKIYFSIIKPLNKLLKKPKINKWCAILCNYRPQKYDKFKRLTKKVKYRFFNLFLNIFHAHILLLLIVFFKKCKTLFTHSLHIKSCNRNV